MPSSHSLHQLHECLLPLLLLLGSHSHATDQRHKARFALDAPHFRVMGVILGGSSVRSCAATCCNTSRGWPCFLSSLRCSSVVNPSVIWQSYFSSVSVSSTVSLIEWPGLG